MDLVVKTSDVGNLKRALPSYYKSSEEYKYPLMLYIVDTATTAAGRNKNKEDIRSFCRDYRIDTVFYSSTRERDIFSKFLDTNGITSSKYCLSSPLNVANMAITSDKFVFINDFISAYTTPTHSSNWVVFKNNNRYYDPCNYTSSTSLGETISDSVQWELGNLNDFCTDLGVSYKSLRPKYQHSGHTVKGSPFGVVCFTQSGVIGDIGVYSQMYPSVRGHLYSSKTMSYYGSRSSTHTVFSKAPVGIDSVFGIYNGNAPIPMFPDLIRGRGGDFLYPLLSNIFRNYSVSKHFTGRWKAFSKPSVPDSGFDQYDLLYYILTGYCGSGSFKDVADYLSTEANSNDLRKTYAKAVFSTYLEMKNRMEKLKVTKELGSFGSLQNSDFLANYGILVREWENILSLYKDFQKKGKSIFTVL